MKYLLTVKGSDRKGLVESLATHIQNLGGNWLESRLCRLGGQFAGIVSVEFSGTPDSLPPEVDTLQCEWSILSDDGGGDGASRKATIKILAADRPGIVKQISHVLTSRGANIEEVESHIRSAPFSGELMFEAIYAISIDHQTEEEHLRHGLEDLAEELMCDLDYETE